MLPITFDRVWPLHGSAMTRLHEVAAASIAGPHQLMQRAGLAVARLALALAPHARQVWIACGPGNNGGDGLEAAVHLQRWGKQPIVRWIGDIRHMPPDAAASLKRARDAHVPFTEQVPELAPHDLAIDALLGLGSTRPAQDAMADCIAALNDTAAPVLAVDLPTGLSADTGLAAGPAVRAQHTLSLLTLKPGLFTGQGRDLSGAIWFDALAAGTAPPPSAWLAAPPPPRLRPHASHKGSFGDVAVVGGAPGMEGAALLAASAALHAGAGRVYIAPMATPSPASLADAPELMWRAPADLALDRLAVACGCGGGTQVAAVLRRMLDEAAQLVLDADALNAIAADPVLQDLLRRRQRPTVLTPHPLEAARLLGCQTRDIQADRLEAARQLSLKFGAVALLKGSGTVVAAPDQTPAINPTGNGKLATAGAGDVLAGLIAARLAAGETALDAARHAAFQHGELADRWPKGLALTAAALARAAC